MQLKRRWKAPQKLTAPLGGGGGLMCICVNLSPEKNLNEPSFMPRMKYHHKEWDEQAWKGIGQRQRKYGNMNHTKFIGLITPDNVIILNWICVTTISDSLFEISCIHSSCNGNRHACSWAVFLQIVFSLERNPSSYGPQVSMYVLKKPPTPAAPFVKYDLLIPSEVEFRLGIYILTVKLGRRDGGVLIYISTPPLCRHPHKR